MKKEKLKVEELNPEKAGLTIEKLKTFKGLENLTDDEAKETVFALQTFASILYDLVNEPKKSEIKNINEPNNTNHLKIAA